MKSRMFEKIMSTGIAMVMGAALLTGCSGSVAATDTDKETATSTETVTTEAVATEAVEKENKDSKDTVLEVPYFTKGVYVNYAVEAEDPPLTYFYVFYDENAGCTDDATTGMGLPFSCEQKIGEVSFSFGGADESLEDVFIVEKVENGAVTGHFDDGLKLVFVPEIGADPDNFNAQNYVNGAKGEDLVYSDANGWSVKYDPSVITVNQGGPVTTFVYTGESAGTNMITVTYNVDKDAKTAIADMAKSWGENAVTSDGPFPGAEDVTGYWATLPPAGEGSGLYETAVARDYMGGYLMFELTGHNSGNEEMDMAVSDTMAAIIDSLEFAQ